MKKKIDKTNVVEFDIIKDMEQLCQGKKYIGGSSMRKIKNTCQQDLTLINNNGQRWYHICVSNISQTLRRIGYPLAISVKDGTKYCYKYWLNLERIRYILVILAKDSIIFFRN